MIACSRLVMASGCSDSTRLEGTERFRIRGTPQRSSRLLKGRGYRSSTYPAYRCSDSTRLEGTERPVHQVGRLAHARVAATRPAWRVLKEVLVRDR